jgi:hypothetical protein
MSVKDDLTLCRAYAQKADFSVSKNIFFGLTLADYKRLRKRKRCYFTNIELNNKNFSLDRVDNSKGYTKENTVPCSKDFNTFKSHIENPNNKLTIELVLKALTKWEKYN